MAANASQTPTPRPRRKPGQRVPPILRTIVQAKAIVGDSKAQIARDLGMADNTVTKILNSQDLTELRESGRSSVAQMIPKSVQVFAYHLDRNDKDVARDVLKGMGVLAPDAQVAVGIFSQSADVDIQGLMGLAGVPQANCAPIGSESGADAVDAEQVPGNNSPSTDAK